MVLTGALDKIMAQGSPVIASGLERDYRQDEFPTRYLGEQDEFPTACRPTDPSGLPNNFLDQLPIQETPPAPTTSQICGFRKSEFLLGILAFVLFVLLVVGGAVMGSLLARKKSHDSEKKRCVCVDVKEGMSSARFIHVLLRPCVWEMFIS